MKMTSPKREARHRQLLQAALRVFSRDGFDGASVADIAEEAGIAKGSVYLYFDSKEALAAALVRDVFTDHSSREPLELETDPLGAILGFCTAKQDRILKLGEFAPIVLHMWGHVGKSETDLVGRAIRQMMAECRFLLETLLEKAKKESRVPSEVDAGVTSRVVLAIAYGVIQARVAQGTGESARQLSAPCAVKAYLTGLGAKF